MLDTKIQNLVQTLVQYRFIIRLFLHSITSLNSYIYFINEVSTIILWRAISLSWKSNFRPGVHGGKCEIPTGGNKSLARKFFYYTLITRIPGYHFEGNRWKVTILIVEFYMQRWKRKILKRKTWFYTSSSTVRFRGESKHVKCDTKFSLKSRIQKSSHLYMKYLVSKKQFDWLLKINFFIVFYSNKYLIIFLENA